MKLNIFLKHRANLSTHTLRGFIRHADFSDDLTGGNPATGRCHQEHGIELLLKRRARLFHNCFGQWIDMVPAGIAGIGGRFVMRYSVAGVTECRSAIGCSRGELLDGVSLHG